MVFCIKVNTEKRAIQHKWMEHEYHAQDNCNMLHKVVKMSCNTKKFHELDFCGAHYKPHGVRGLRKHHHLILYHKLGH